MSAASSSLFRADSGIEILWTASSDDVEMDVDTPVKEVATNVEIKSQGGEIGQRMPKCSTPVLALALSLNTISQIRQHHPSFPPHHTNGITSLTPCSSLVLSSSEDGTVIVWKDHTVLRTLRGHEGCVTCVAVTDGMAFTGGADRNVIAWNVASGEKMWTGSGHSRWVMAICAARGKVYTGSSDKTVRVWDATSGTCIRVLEGHGDGIMGICGLGGGSGDCLRVLGGGGLGGIRSVCVVGGRLYAAGDDGGIVEWDVRGGRKVRTLEGHGGAVATLCASADGKLYSGSGDRTVRIWELASLPPPPSHTSSSTSTGSKDNSSKYDRPSHSTTRPRTTPRKDSLTAPPPSQPTSSSIASRAFRPISGFLDNLLSPNDNDPAIEEIHVSAPNSSMRKISYPVKTVSAHVFAQT
ncbi:WD40-repeat-containing domain protein [Chytridium lagenaria]|nr:WD40-repeat-containing domain protein [Chytridium lagenaria]